MTNEQWASRWQEYLMHTYRPAPLAFVRGEGAYLWDADGKRYLDFVAGIAVCGTGHCHPRIVKAIQEQAERLLHTSNLYCIPPAVELAQRLVEISFADRCFFCNSGAEANEAAIKLARKWAGKVGKKGRTIITALGSFHGRTLATVTATGQEKYNKPFQPLPPGFKYVPYNDVDALSQAVDHEVCAVMLE
ncbi:MAG: aminotransferase class III-fold pyridoxal phosphate-dependent enzyme, partial [Armatimonadetes bacterium]|nr:aminotransferase class III-fold pyridoxal phosphate-dependent enzyme [Armatimonadota bacterium]